MACKQKTGIKTILSFLVVLMALGGLLTVIFSGPSPSLSRRNKSYHKTVQKEWEFVIPEPVVVIKEEDFLPEEYIPSTEKLSKLLGQYIDHPTFGKEAKIALDKLPELHSLLLEAKNHSSDIEIDLILQDHGEQEEVDTGAPHVLISQEIVYQFLKQQKYDVAAVEGTNLDPVTIDGLAKAIMEYGAKIEMPISYDEALERTYASADTTAYVRYILGKGSTPIIGAEVDELNHLHRSVLDEFMLVRDQEVFLSLDEINSALSRARSEIAVARTIRKLEQVNAKRGAIIIGYAHAEDMIHLFKVLHVRSSVYSTVVRE